MLQERPGRRAHQLRAEGRLGEGSLVVSGGKALVEAELIHLHFTLDKEAGPEPVKIRNAVQVRVS